MQNQLLAFGVRSQSPQRFAKLPIVLAQIRQLVQQLIGVQKQKIGQKSNGLVFRTATVDRQSFLQPAIPHRLGDVLQLRVQLLLLVRQPGFERRLQLIQQAAIQLQLMDIEIQTQQLSRFGTQSRRVDSLQMARQRRRGGIRVGGQGAHRFRES